MYIPVANGYTPTKGGNNMLPSYYYEKYNKNRNKKKKQLLLFGAAVLLVMSAVIAWMLVRFPKAADVAKPSNAVRLNETASLELTTLYACGHKETKRLPLPEELKNQTQEEVALRYPSWNILSFRSDFLVAEQVMATECDNHFLLTLDKNKLVVTKSKDKHQVIVEQEINLNMLTQEDREILASGILINSEYELLEILESFQ